MKPYFSGGGDDSAASYANTEVTIGTAVGPFKVCGFLGEGGYGIVYLTEQERPIRRRVALKIVKPGMDSRQVIARFEAERQALARSLRRELEWIPLKAMRKEPSRRYQSASEFANDIENYLKGAPLLAAPESALYRARRLVQRHRGAVVPAALLFTSLLIGFAVTGRMYVVAEKSRHVAQKAEVAEAAERQVAERERDRAVKAEQEATRRLADLYQEQGRRCMELGDLDRALGSV